MQHDDMQRRHQKTAVLVTRFLSHANVASDVVSTKCFIDLLSHLNPMAEVPTMAQVEDFRNELELSFDPDDPNTVPICVFCGSDEFPRVSLSEDDAAVYLALAVLSNRKTLACAKKDMCRDRFVFCQGHTLRSNQQMMTIIGNADIDSVERVAVTKISPVYAAFNKLKSMYQVYTDQRVTPITYFEFRIVLKKWLEINAARKLICEVSANEAFKSMEEIDPNPMEVSVKMEESESVDGSPPQLEFGAGDPVAEKLVEEEMPSSSSTTNAPIKTEETFVKLEEPDVDEQQAESPIAVTNKQKIYTLPNGKKVIKAPMSSAAAMLARRAAGGGSLVTYRRVVNGESAKTVIRRVRPLKTPE